MVLLEGSNVLRSFKSLLTTSSKSPKCSLFIILSSVNSSESKLQSSSLPILSKHEKSQSIISLLFMFSESWLLFSSDSVFLIIGSSS